MLCGCNKYVDVFRFSIKPGQYKQTAQTDRRHRQAAQTDGTDRQHRQTAQTDRQHRQTDSTDRQTAQTDSTDRQHRQTDSTDRQTQHDRTDIFQNPSNPTHKKCVELLLCYFLLGKDASYH